MIGRDSIERSGAETTNVVIIDGLALVRYGLRALCAAAPELCCVASVSNAESGHSAVVRHAPQLVLLDSALDPDTWLISRIASACPSPTIVVLLGPDHQSQDYPRAALRAGATGTISRAADPPSLLTAIRHALNQRRCHETQHAGTPLQLENRAVTPTLSTRQLEVLTLLSHGHDNPTIARYLELSAETVRTHVKAILTRLDVRNRTHAVTRAYHLGLLTTGNGPTLSSATTRRGQAAPAAGGRTR